MPHIAGPWFTFTYWTRHFPHQIIRSCPYLSRPQGNCHVLRAAHRVAIIGHPSIVVTMLLLGGVVPIVGAEPASRPLAVGHRGFLQSAPENTISAFRACLSLRVGFEFDIRRAKDKQLICLHDATVVRTTNGKGKAADLAFADLKRLDAGSWFDATFKGERIPSVDEVFALLAEQATDASLIAVDLKETGDGIEEAVVKSAERHKVLDRLLFIGAAIESAEVRARLHTANPRAHVARLAVSPEKIADAIDDTKADWVYVRFLPSTDDVKRIHKAGKRLFLAGPLVAGNKPDSWREAQELGFDAILTDFPLELQSQLRSSK